MSIPTPVLYFSGSEENKLLDISIDPQDIADKLSKLKSDKAAGDDNMAPRFLKEVSNEITMPVALIFHKSLDTGQVPQDISAWISVRLLLWTNLLSFLETVTSLVDAKEHVDAIYLDLAKAFDKVPHKRLLLKLEAHGIGGLVSNSWLADRRQRVIVDGSHF